MYAIGEVAKMTGVSAYTLRYYEKIGLLPNPTRDHGLKQGKRRYDAKDVQLITFIHGLKETGMRLKDIAAFTERGCLLHEDHDREDVRGILQKRIDILDRHMSGIAAQVERLMGIRDLAATKRDVYAKILKG